MGIFSKIADIINSNVNHILDKSQDPVKMANLMINEMEDTLVELKSNMARVMAEQKTLRRNMKRVQSEVDFFSNKAELPQCYGQTVAFSPNLTYALVPVSFLLLKSG